MTSSTQQLSGRALRERLDLSIPIPDNKVGYCFRFEVQDEISCYGAEIATAMAAAIKHVKFSGRCEFYAGDRFEGATPVYLVAIGLKPSTWAGKAAELSDLIKGMSAVLPFHLKGITLGSNGSEFTMMSAIKQSLIPAGVAEYDGGHFERVISPAGYSSDSWFIGATRGD